MSNIFQKTLLYDFYGEHAGVRIARKHIGWYLSNLSVQTGNDKGRQHAESFRRNVNQVDEASTQLELVTEFFNLQQNLLAA